MQAKKHSLWILSILLEAHAFVFKVCPFDNFALGALMPKVDDRLDRMIEIARETGMSLDDIVRAVGRADQSTFDAFSANPSRLPMYMKSSVNP